MYIGKLNDKIESITYSCTKKGTDIEPLYLEKGNPFKNELLHIKWSKLTTDGIDLTVTLPENYYVASVVIRMQDECTPLGFSLYTKDKKTLLSQYRAETGCTISKNEITLTADRTMSQFVIETDADFTDILFESIEIYGAVFEGEKIFPTVDNFVIKDGNFSFGSKATACVKSDCASAAFSILSEKISEKAKVELTLTQSADITFEQDDTVDANGYALCVNKDGIVIKASDKRGFIQGVETLIKLLDNKQVPCCDIKDEPFCKFRGVHLFLPAEDQMDFTKRLIKHLLSPMGYNFIILQFSAGMVLDNHPEINESFLTAIEKSSKGEWPEFPHNALGGGKLVSKQSVRDLVEYSRAYGIDIVPEIQSLGHVQYLTLSHPEIAEIPEKDDKEKIDTRAEDKMPEDFYKHSYCPSNPESYKLLFEVADEIIDVVKPEYVHMGHDEVYQLGVCPICKKRNPADILADDINKIYDYLKSKNLKMMIWADMLQPVTKYKAFDAIHKIPKDILLLDFIWYFHVDKDIEENLVKYDFDVLIGNLYSSYFPRYEKRIRTKGVHGGQVSAWVKTAEYELGREGKLYDFLYTSQMLWSESYDSRLRYAYDRIIREFIPSLRAKLRDEKLVMPAKTDVVDKNNVSGVYDSLIFEHYANAYYRRQPWVDVDTIANYEVVYEDGESVLVPITYGGNICYRYRRQNEPFSAKFYRHNGYCSTWFTDSYEIDDENGKETTVYSYEWKNPCPDKKIKAVNLIPCEFAEVDVTLHCLKGIKK